MKLQLRQLKRIGFAIRFIKSLSLLLVCRIYIQWHVANPYYIRQTNSKNHQAAKFPKISKKFPPIWKSQREKKIRMGKQHTHTHTTMHSRCSALLSDYEVYVLSIFLNIFFSLVFAALTLNLCCGASVYTPSNRILCRYKFVFSW